MEERYNKKHLTVHPSVFQFKGTDEPVICSHFGCGKQLTQVEQLAGSKCTEHMKQIDKTFKHYNL